MLCITARLCRLGNTHALYQGTNLVGPLRSSKNLSFSPGAFSLRPNGKHCAPLRIIADKCFVRDEP
jgi:hypothetical protein